MPEIDLVQAIKWVLIIAALGVIVAGVVTLVSPLVSTGRVAMTESMSGRIDATGTPAWTDTGTNEANKPSVRNVVVAVGDAVLGPGGWDTFRGWITGAFLGVVLLAMAWGIWKLVT